MSIETGIDYLNPKNVKVFFETLPKMVIAHSKRVMNISKFLIKRFEIEDFYLDLHLTESSFLDACLFHDIGKSEVEKEYLFRDLCQSPYDVHKYLEHIQFGLQHIIDPDIDKYIAEHPNNFKSYFYQVLKYHHGPSRNKFPIVGQIVYIADMIDNSCFKVASNTFVELDNKNFGNIWNKLLIIFQNDGVLENILKIFKDESFITDLQDFLCKLYKKTTYRTRYGITVNEYNIYDLFRLKEASTKDDSKALLRDHEVFARKIIYDINTRYYGKIDHEEFIYVALKNKFAKKLDSAFFNHLKENLKESYNDLPVLTFIGITIDSVNKITIKRIVKIAKELDIPYTNLGILIDLYYDELTSVQKIAIEELKGLGFKIAINQARAEYINIFHETSIDYAFYNNSLVSDVDEIFIELIQSLGTIVILSQKGDNKYRYVCAGDPNFRRVEEIKEDEQQQPSSNE